MMNPQRPFAAALALACSAGIAYADDVSAKATGESAKDATPDSVIEVTGRRQSDTDARRASSVAKIVVGHDEIMHYGDTNIGDVLKRLPGVTIGGGGGRSGGEIRMRGLGSGYTQILINGEPAPRGFALDAISPELIERIEVIRAPLAEYSTQAIAGTLNIVLRQAPPKRNKQLTLSANLEDNNHPEARVAYQYNDKSGEYAWQFAGTIKNMGQLEGSSYARTQVQDPNGNLLEDQLSTDRQYRKGYNANIAPRLNWRRADDDTASLQLFVFRRAAVDQITDTVDQRVGVAPYTSQTGRSLNDSNVYKLTANRVLPFAGGSLDVRLSLSDFDSSVDTHYVQVTSAGQQSLESDSTNRTNGGNTAAKWTRPLGDDHKLVAGYEGDWSTQHQTLLQSGYIQSAPPVGSDVSANVLRLASFVQDEWSLSPAWGFYAGLRWESIETKSDASSGNVSNRSAVLSPSLQSVYRFGDEKKDQFRWSLSRSYRAPNTSSLLPRVQLSTENDAFHPDSEGNPNLRPELAWGMEFALEHYFKDGGMLSANVFDRRVSDVVRTLTTLGANGRWISQPINLDRADVYGIEFDGKARLDQFMPHAPAVEIHANVARYWSQVNGIPGPYNVLSSQTPASANLGADYTIKSASLTLGANANWVPGVTATLSPTQQSYTGSKVGIDAYALWKFKSGTQFRIAATNLLHRDYLTNAENSDNGLLNTRQTVTRGWANWTATLDLKY